MAIGSNTVSFSVPINWLIAIPVLAVVAILAFTLSGDAVPPVLVYATAVIAGSAALITAVNNIDQREAAGVKAAKQAALDYSARWNEPEFLPIKLACKEIRAKLKAMSGIAEQWVYLKEDAGRFSNLMLMLNTFEQLYVGIDAGLIDEPTAKRLFQTLVVEYWHATEEVVKKVRAEVGHPRLYCEFEKLYNKWKD